MSTKSTLITIVIVLVIVFAVWYLSYMFIKQPQQGSQQGINNAPDTTANISNDLKQVPSDSSVNGEMNTLNQDLQNF